MSQFRLLIYTIVQIAISISFHPLFSLFFESGIQEYFADEVGFAFRFGSEFDPVFNIGDRT
jgi:hypothetical protein